MKKVIRKSLILFLLLLLTGCSSKTSASNPTPPTSSTFEIDYLSVGQADAAVIKCDDHYAMIDCGADSVQENGFSSYKIDLYLQQESITEFDYIFVSHYDEDHYDGFADILQNRKLGKAYGPSGINDKDVQSLNKFKNCLKEKKKKIKTPKVGDTFELGSALIEVLAVDAVDSSQNTNDSSLVLMITYGKNKFLFVGDAESKTEKALMGLSNGIDCDVLKVAHHGSSTSTSAAFVQKAKPEYAILSVAADRKLPDATVLDNLESVSCVVYRTDETGNVTCKSDGKNVSFYNTDGTQLNE